MKKIILSLLFVSALAFGGCTDGKQSGKGLPSGGKTSKKADSAMNKELFGFTIDGLNRLEEFQTGAVQSKISNQIEELSKKSAAGSSDKTQSTLLSAWPESDSLLQIADRLSQWIRTQTPPEWQPDPLLAELPEELKNLPLAAGLDKMEFSLFDSYYLQEAVYMRDVATAAHGKSIDDISRANHLFDWTVRNIQLDDDAPDNIPQFPWETLFFGHGTAEERAWVFVLLARQQGLEAAVLEIDKDIASSSGKATQEPRFWCAALLIDNKAYLFDLRCGLPIPGPGGVRKGESGELEIVPASLDQLSADPSLLERMNAGVEHPYSITPDDLKKVTVLIEASPASLSRRMKTVESYLQGAQKMVLTASAKDQADRWKKVPGLNACRLWRLPYETIRQRSALQPPQIIRLLSDFLPFYSMPTGLLYGEAAMQKAIKTPPELRNIYKGTSPDASDKKPKSPEEIMMQDTEAAKTRRYYEELTRLNTTFSAPLFKGRVMHLKGQMSGEVNAIDYYRKSRPSMEELRTIQDKLLSGIVINALPENNKASLEEKEKLVRDIVEAIVTGKTLIDEENQKFAEAIKQRFATFVLEQLGLIQRGKQDASYWLGLAACEQGNFDSAVEDYFGPLMTDWPNGPWTAGASYNIARSFEAEGKTGQAVKAYRADLQAPDTAGRLLRAKWLEELEK